MARDDLKRGAGSRPSAKSARTTPSRAADRKLASPERSEHHDPRPPREEEPKKPEEPDREQDWPDPVGPKPERLLEEYPTGRIPGQRERDRYTPYIVMRYRAGDPGFRPLPPGTVFWHSPDVWVVSSAGYNVPVAGEANTMFARVNNWGLKDAAGVVIRYWWANPSLAITEASAHQIGMATAFVPSGNSVVVPCPTPWVPVMENGGHECVFAEAWVPYFDPIVAPLEPVTDRHVCQKNLSVVEAEPGAQITFPIHMANISGIAQRVTVQMRTLSFREIRRALTAPEIGYQERLLETSQGLPVKLELSADGEFLSSSTAIYPLRLLSAAQIATDGGATDCQPLGVVTRTTSLQAWESRTLTLHARIPPDARPHQAFGFDIQQRMGEVVTGGYTLYILVGR